jgi:hypothetical protein
VLFITDDDSSSGSDMTEAELVEVRLIYYYQALKINTFTSPNQPLKLKKCE